MQSSAATYMQKYVMHVRMSVKSFPLLKNANNALMHVESVPKNVVICQDKE
jgi:hypothetical protein